MPVAFSILPFCLFAPFGQYRHGCDPPARLIPFSFLPSAFDGDPPAFARDSDFLTFSLVSSQLSGVEPFSPLFRHTARELRFLESASLRIGEEKEKDEAPILLFPVDVRKRKAQSQYPLRTVPSRVRLSVRFPETIEYKQSVDTLDTA